MDLAGGWEPGDTGPQNLQRGAVFTNVCVARGKVDVGPRLHARRAALRLESVDGIPKVPKVAALLFPELALEEVRDRPAALMSIKRLHVSGEAGCAGTVEEWEDPTETSQQKLSWVRPP